MVVVVVAMVVVVVVVMMMMMMGRREAVATHMGRVACDACGSPSTTPGWPAWLA